MEPLSWTPREMEAWRAFEEGDLPRYSGTYNWPFGKVWSRMSPIESNWTPKIEVWEKNEGYSVRAELPGVKEEDIEIFTTKNTLTISGTRRPSPDVEEDEYRRCEMCYGPFTRTISMSPSVNPDGVEATYENGILNIFVPKSKEAIGRKIEIKSK